jgi:hypothetical protein
MRVAVLAAVIIALFAIWWGRRYSGQPTTLVITVGLIEAIIAVVIWFFSGAFTFNPLFWSWLVGMNVCIILPYIAGAAVGMLSSRRRQSTLFE